VAVFYLFLLKPIEWVAAGIIAALVVATFVPIRFLHPMRVDRNRWLNVAILTVWSILAVVALLEKLEPSPWIIGALLVIAVYFAVVGSLGKMR